MPACCACAARYGIECPTCKEKSEYLTEIIYRLALPVRLTVTGGRLEVMEQPFIHQAYAKQMYEQKHEFMQRFFAQLVGMVHSRFLSDMQVPCTSVDEHTNHCLSHLPLWTYANADEYAHIWGMTPDMLRGSVTVQAGQVQAALTATAGQAVSAACSAGDASCQHAAGAAGDGGQGRGGAGAKAGSRSNVTTPAPPSQQASGSQGGGEGVVGTRGTDAAQAGQDRGPPARYPPSISSFAETGGYMLLDRDRVRAYAVQDMNALIDKFFTNEIAGDVQSLLTTLDYLSSMPASPSPADSAGGGFHPSGAADKAGGGGGQGDYSEKLQVGLGSCDSVAFSGGCWPAAGGPQARRRGQRPGGAPWVGSGWGTARGADVCLDMGWGEVY